MCSRRPAVAAVSKSLVHDGSGGRRRGRAQLYTRGAVLYTRGPVMFTRGTELYTTGPVLLTRGAVLYTRGASAVY